MILLHEERKRVIKGQEKINFSSFSSLHLITISARVRGKKQISGDATDDEDLVIKIDGKSYPKLSDPARKIDYPAAFSGGSLHDLAKSVYFLSFLKGKDHQIELLTDKPQDTATLESLTIDISSLGQELFLKPEDKAEDGDRRPWVTFVLDNLPLEILTVTLTYSRRKWDSDDVKIIVDDKVQFNLLGGIKRFLWRYLGSWLPPFISKTETEIFPVNLSPGLHYVEFWADRMPVLHSINLGFGTTPPPPQGIPTVDSPDWTNDFYDDTEEMLLARVVYGEVGGESYEAKVAVGWSIKNRVEDSRGRWGRHYHEVILQGQQYDALWDKRTYDKVRKPPISENKKEKEVWDDSYRAGVQVISGQTPDPTRGANHFYATTIPRPFWADEKEFTVEIGITRFYRL